MTGPLPRVRARDLVRVLEREGWRRVRRKGGHLHLNHPERPGRITVPVHAGRTLKLATLASILTQAGISADELRELLVKEEAIDMRYTVILIPDPDEGGYTVTVPALPGCVTEGDTREEALANAREAITLHVEELAAAGEPVPSERGEPQLAAVEVTGA